MSAELKVGFWNRLLRTHSRSTELDHEIDKELQFHLEEQTREYVASGMNPERARREAQIALGGESQIAEEVRGTHRLPRLDDFFQDLRHALRRLRNMPAFSVAAILTLALGIGANTAIFSVIENVLLRPLPYKSPAELVQISNTYPPTLPQIPASAGDFEDFRQHAGSFSGMGAYVDTPRGMNLTGEGEPTRVETRFATSGLFPMLGIDPVIGRSFTAEEDKPGSAPAILLSHATWQSRFGADPRIVGRTLTLDDQGYLVAGVLPEQMQLAPDTDIWIPIGQYSAGPDPYRYHEFKVVGRLRPGVTIEQAQAELTTLNRQEQQALPDTHKNIGAAVAPLEDPSAAAMRTSLLVLFGAVGLVLLVACANFVNLLMARNAARQREFALRAALGASRSRLLTDVLSESILLSLAGGALGILLAQGGMYALHEIIPANLLRMEPATLNITVLAFAVALSLLSGLACGLIPAFHSLKPQLHIALKEGTRTTSGTGGQGMRRALVVAEIALAIVPLVGAGLLIRSFRRLLEVDPGFHHDHILAMEIDKSQPSALELNKLTTAERIDFLRRQSLQYDELMGRIQALPGVQAAGGITVLPLGSNLRSASRFLVEGEPSPADGVRPVAETRGISAGYFSAMGIPLRMGRLLDPHDYASQNVLVNEAFAKKFWPGGDAIGKRINFCSLAAQPCWMTIVGVVGNVHQYGLEAAPTFDEYGTGGWPPYAIIRTASDPAAGAQTVIAEIHKFDATLPVTHVMTVDDLLSESVSPRRFSTFLLGLFAGLALLLAMVGVYAVMSYAIRLRRTEIGVRMALGARPRDIWWLIIGGGARLIVGGIALGLGGAFAVTKLMSSLLYGVSATDPATFGAVAVLLAGVALLACYIPAHNAMRVDPMAALRSE